MLPPTHRDVLHKLYAQLKDTSINWVVTGSLSFALQGVPITPNDIDLQSDKTGAYTIEQHFSEFVVRKVAFLPSEKICSYFGVLTIDGINVEIMGDLQKRKANGEWEEPVDLALYKHTVVFDGMHIPVLTLEYEYYAYMKLERFERAQMLMNTIQRKARGDIPHSLSPGE
jgi:hypothetical protein